MRVEPGQDLRRRTRTDGAPPRRGPVRVSRSGSRVPKAQGGGPGTPPLSPEDVRALVRAELRGLLVKLLDDRPTVYSSRKGHHAPGYAEREWKALAKRLGVRRGRWWVVERSVLEAYEAQGDGKPQNDTAAPTPSTWSPAAALAEAGLRRART
jgi:hypothetical protein